MTFEFDNDKPIYKQLVDQLKISIITGIYKKGDKLPSVRDLALSIKVNPNTIQRALTELEDVKLITTKRTLGKFVTDDDNVLKTMKKSLAGSKIEKFIKDMNELNISKEEVIEFIRNEGR